MQVHLGAEQQATRQAHAVGDPDETDVPTRAAGPDGLLHGLLGADRLDDAVCAQPVGEVLHSGDTLLAAFLDDVGGPELLGECLALRVAGHRDDPFGPQLLGRQDRQEADCAVTHHRDGLARTRFRGDRPEPARAEHVGGGQQRGQHVGVLGTPARHDDEGAVGLRDADELRLGAADEPAVDATGGVTGIADLAGVVRDAEGSDHEITRLHRCHG